MSDRDAYVEKMKAKIDEWSADIKKLQAQAEGAQADARIKYAEQIEEMKKQRDAAEAKMKEAQEASLEAWADMRKGMEAAWDSMTAAVKNALGRFG